MRKSVLIGFGLWLLAVTSVAAVAWIAIDAAGRRVTAVQVSAPLPVVTGSPSWDGVGDALPSQPDLSLVASSGRIGRPATGGDAQRPEVQSFFGSFSADGGRVRARCREQEVTLDGGFARPDPGWLVRVLPRDETRLDVFFGSRYRAIDVIAQCDRGRPVFSQHSRPLPRGVTVPAPAQTTPPTPTTLAEAPLPPLGLRGPSASATPSTSAGSVDPAQVRAYVQAQDRNCAQSRWSTDWCRSWGSMSPQDRYLLVWRWLLSIAEGDSGWTGHPDPGAGAAADTPAGTPTSNAASDVTPPGRPGLSRPVPVAI